MKELIPVIHTHNNFQVYEQAELCEEAGIKKIFLIYHGKVISKKNNWLSQIELAFRVKENYKLWVGVNILNHDPFYTYPLAAVYGLDGLWIDYHDSRISAVRNMYSEFHQPAIFSSFEFKYQSDEITFDYLEAGADDQCDVIVTSGDKTGAASVIREDTEICIRIRRLN